MGIVEENVYFNIANCINGTSEVSTSFHSAFVDLPSLNRTRKVPLKKSSTQTSLISLVLPSRTIR